MSIQAIRTLLEAMEQHGSFKLFGVNHVSNTAEDRYECFDLVLEPNSLLSGYFGRVSHGKLHRRLESAERIIDYVGEFSASNIERLSLEYGPGNHDPIAKESIYPVESPIQEQVNKLYQAVLNSADAHNAPELSEQMKAFMLVATCPNGNGEVDTAYFVTVRSPFVAMRHRFFYCDGAYREDNGSCIYLIEHFDFILYKQTCYAFTDKIEPFFSLDRTFKKKCDESVEYVTACGIVSDVAQFRAYATSGYSPRKFLGFRRSLASRMTEDLGYRRRICDRFGIKMTPAGEIDTSDNDASDRFIRLVCGRGAQDPLDESACAVPSVSPWI